jgi:L-amino acid N-acyltransferase YncA
MSGVAESEAETCKSITILIERTFAGASMALRIRPASHSDLTQIHSIYEYYVMNTVVAFLINKPPIDYIKSRFEATRERGLPYLVAEHYGSNCTSQVVGYAYASPFRGFMLGYGHSVEMTIFCHPDHVGQGVGSSLMMELLRLLKETKHASRELGHEDQPKEFDIKTVMAIMSVDDEREDKGLGLRDWYVKWGFSEVGRLKRIGFKNGRW